MAEFKNKKKGLCKDAKPERRVVKAADMVHGDGS
jgi:hypothetical protein